MKVSVVINALNAQEYIRDCLESVTWADEIVVLDMCSDDRTAKICAQYAVRFIPIERQDYVEEARNAGLDAATGDWILALDPDERVPPKLAALVPTLIEDGNVSAYDIPRKNYIFGEWIRTMHWWPDYQCRLLRKGKARWKGIIHETPDVEGEIRRVPLDPDLALVHINYTSVSLFVEKLNRYTTLIAKDLQASNTRFRWWQLLYRPLREFVKRYIYYQGFRQGLYGLLLSLLMAFYHFVIWAKLWEMQRTDYRG